MQRSFTLFILRIVKLFNANTTFFYISRFCYWLPWKGCILPSTWSSTSSRKFFCIVFTTLHFQSINSASINKQVNVSFRHHPNGISVLNFSVYGVSHFRSAFSRFNSSLHWSSNGSNMFSKSMYSINGILNWYWPSWNFN